MDFETNLAPFRDKFKHLKKEIPRLEEFLIGVETLLVKNPKIGQKTNRPGIYAIPMIDLPHHPKVVLYYLIVSNEKIIFVDICIGRNNGPTPIIL